MDGNASADRLFCDICESVACDCTMDRLRGIIATLKERLERVEGEADHLRRVVDAYWDEAAAMRWGVAARLLTETELREAYDNKVVPLKPKKQRGGEADDDSVLW